MNMPFVRECAAEACAYNRDRRCHALAITIGERCDTYCGAPVKGGDVALFGRVGACKRAGCRFNASLECTASGIAVGRGTDDEGCLTYLRRA